MQIHPSFIQSRFVLESFEGFHKSCSVKCLFCSRAIIFHVLSAPLNYSQRTFPWQRVRSLAPENYFRIPEPKARVEKKEISPSDKRKKYILLLESSVSFLLGFLGDMIGVVKLLFQFSLSAQVTITDFITFSLHSPPLFSSSTPFTNELENVKLNSNIHFNMRIGAAESGL